MPPNELTSCTKQKSSPKISWKGISVFVLCVNWVLSGLCKKCCGRSHMCTALEVSGLMGEGGEWVCRTRKYGQNWKTKTNFRKRSLEIIGYGFIVSDRSTPPPPSEAPRLGTHDHMHRMTCVRIISYLHASESMVGVSAVDYCRILR